MYSNVQSYYVYTSIPGVLDITKLWTTANLQYKSPLIGFRGFYHQALDCCNLQYKFLHQTHWILWTPSTNIHSSGKIWTPTERTHGLLQFKDCDIQSTDLGLR